MKLRIISLLVVVLGMMAAGCNKKEKVKPEESGIAPFLTEEYDLRIGQRPTGPWEVGTVFSVSVPGKITRLGANMPEPATYRVALWDYDTQTLLRLRNVEQTAPDIPAFGDIEPIQIEADRWYVITLNTQAGGVNKKYKWASRDGGANFLPMTVGKVTIHESMYRGTADLVFPNTIQHILDEIYGFTDFKFISD